MRLLGTNDEGKTATEKGFVPYYKRPHFVSECKKKAVFVFYSMPKFRFVTVPKNTRYEAVIFQVRIKKHILFNGEYVIKSGQTINVLDFSQ